MTGVFEASIEVGAPPERVFRYFTEPELLVRWIGDYAVLDATPGGEFTLDIEGTPVRGAFLEVEPPERVVVSWGHAGSDSIPPGSTRVHFLLTPTDSGGTHVRIEHHDLPEDWMPQHRVGWPMFLGRLHDVAA